MKLIIFLIVICSCAHAQGLQFKNVSSDTKHVWAGFFITVISTEVSYRLTDKIDFGLKFGLLTGVVAGGAKEIGWDKWLKRGVPTWGDGLGTAYGSGTGTISMCVRFDLENKYRHRAQHNKRHIHILNYEID